MPSTESAKNLRAAQMAANFLLKQELTWKECNKWNRKPTDERWGDFAMSHRVQKNAIQAEGMRESTREKYLYW